MYQSVHLKIRLSNEKVISYFSFHSTYIGNITDPIHQPGILQRFFLGAVNFWQSIGLLSRWISTTWSTSLAEFTMERSSEISVFSPLFTSDFGKLPLFVSKESTFPSFSFSWNKEVFQWGPCFCNPSGNVIPSLFTIKMQFSILSNLGKLTLLESHRHLKCWHQQFLESEWNLHKVCL